MIPITFPLLVFLCVYLGAGLLELGIEWINIRHLKQQGRQAPTVFQGLIEAGELARMNRYTLDKSRFSMISNAFDKLFVTAVILSGVLPWWATAGADLGFVMAGLVFFAGPALASKIIALPFGYYHNFILEAKYGFNTQTLRIWVTDQIKSVILAMLIGGLLLSAFLLFLRHAGGLWWLWAWGLFFSFQLLMTIAYPLWIAPLFNRFTPIEDGPLKAAIIGLAATQGVPVTGIFQMDASRRTRHTNAYLTGIGKAKRIVLFDSLIKAHEPDEILAVLAHEIGHLKKGHIRLQLLLAGSVSLVLLYLAAVLIQYPALYHCFGFDRMHSYVGIFLVGILWEPAAFALAPLGMAISRCFERQADAFAASIPEAAPAFVKALKKLARDNLTNLNPHPAYVRFHYSHPPLTERIAFMEQFDK